MLEIVADYVLDPFEHRFVLDFAEAFCDDHFDASHVLGHVPPVPAGQQLGVEWREPKTVIVPLLILVFVVDEALVVLPNSISLETYGSWYLEGINQYISSMIGSGVGTYNLRPVIRGFKQGSTVIAWSVSV